MFPILGAALTMAAMLWMTTLAASTPIWVICLQLFAFGAGLGLIMQALNQLPEQLRDAIVNAYADSLAPVFWYLLPFIAVALLLALTLQQIPLSDTAGMVARGEAIGGEEAERLAAAGGAAEVREASDARDAPDVKDDDGELVSQAR